MDRDECPRFLSPVNTPRKIVAACQRLRFHPESSNSEIVLVEKVLADVIPTCDRRREQGDALKPAELRLPQNPRHRLADVCRRFHDRSPCRL